MTVIRFCAEKPGELFENVNEQFISLAAATVDLQK